MGCEVAAGGSWDALDFGDAAFGAVPFGAAAAFGAVVFGAAAVVDEPFFDDAGGSEAITFSVAAGRAVAVGSADDRVGQDDVEAFWLRNLSWRPRDDQRDTIGGRCGGQDRSGEDQPEDPADRQADDDPDDRLYRG